MLLTAVFYVLFPVPVIKQYGQFLVLRGGDGFGGFVYDKAAVVVFRVVAVKENLDQSPKRRVDLLRTPRHVFRRKPHFLRKLFRESGKQRVLRDGQQTPVFLLVACERVLVIRFYLRPRALTLRDTFESGFHILGKAAENLLADAKHPVRNQRPLAHQFQLAHVGKVLFVDERNRKHVVFLSHAVTAVNALFHFQRVVEQVVVNHQRGGFQIKASCAAVGGD